MRLAVIDVGSNSCHMVVADVAPDGGIQVVDRLKEMVRLGRRSFVTGRLDPDAMELGVSAVRTFCRLARACGVDRIRAVATSAVREARNGQAFVDRLRAETGLAVRIISGAEEARLIFRAARHAFGLEGGPHLVLDMGGGSAELVLVKDGRPVWLRSLPLGAVRLTERFLGSDPPTARQLRRVEHHLDRVLGPALLSVRHAGIQRVVGTSGTVNHLVALVCAGRGDDPRRLHGVRATAAEIHRLRRRVVTLDAERRAALPGIDTKRLDLVPAAAILVDYVLAHAGSPDLISCSWALREGLLLDLADRVAGAPARRTNVRRRSVEALAARLGESNGHGRHVARLALDLFDALASALRLQGATRELLEYAALLHDVGRVIDHDRHHRHSSYLIQNSELLGFEPDEIAVMAEVARGHRKQAPKAGDPELHGLSPALRRTVRGLAALVRLADGLDRTKARAVDGIHARLTPKRLVIEIETQADAELELWAAERRSDLLARLLERPVELRAVRPAARLVAKSR